MTTAPTDWNDRFLALFDHCTGLYQKGNRDFTTYYDAAAQALLGEIGYAPREFFDFVEDFCEHGVPTRSTALLVAAVRRDYFHVAMEGEDGSRSVTSSDVPSRGEELDGIPYLPRILAKARAKLRGDLDPDMMFGCGGDRGFLQRSGGIHLADFLRRVWAAGEDDQKIVEWLRK
ncbi:MAG: DUF5069 domain-containing protein [Luteolibacter sp.]|jgi:hypothetical protein